MFTPQTLLAQQSTNIVEALEIPLLLSKMWSILMNERFYQAMNLVGVLMAIFAIGLWCAMFYKSFKTGGLQPALKDLVLPLVLVVMLWNGGKNLKDITLSTKSAISSFSAAGKVADEADLTTEVLNERVSEATAYNSYSM